MGQRISQEEIVDVSPGTRRESPSRSNVGQDTEDRIFAAGESQNARHLIFLECRKAEKVIALRQGGDQVALGRKLENVGFDTHRCLGGAGQIEPGRQSLQQSQLEIFSDRHTIAERLSRQSIGRQDGRASGRLHVGQVDTGSGSCSCRRGDLRHRRRSHQTGQQNADSACALHRVICEPRGYFSRRCHRVTH